MGNSFAFTWEIKIIEWFQSWEGQAGTVFAGFLSMFGEEIILIAILGFLYWDYDKKIGKYIGVNILVALTINPVIKNIFVRRRPYMDYSSIKCLRPVEADADIYDVAAQGYSFPSGHSMNSAVVYPSIYCAFKKKWIGICAAVLPILVGLSRIMLGVHYPTDVLTGWGLGIASVFCISFLQRKISSKAILYFVLTLVTIPGLFFCRSEDYFTALGLWFGFVAADILESRYVNFENTRNSFRMVARVFGGVVIFVIIDTFLKLPFGSEFLHNGTFFSHMVRVVRYAIVAVVLLAVYPLCFRYHDRFFERKEG